MSSGFASVFGPWFENDHHPFILKVYPFYHNTSGRCLGQFSIINGDFNENGSCQFWNAAGDKIFGVYARKGDPAKAEGTWHLVQGTGKFEGMTDEGR